MKIQDEFTNLPISAQRKYQLRKRRDKRCNQCGAPAVAAARCLQHLVSAREWQRNKNGHKKRYYGSVGYRMQERSRRFTKTST